MADSKGFLGALFDFGFQSFVTPKVVKMLYVLIMIGTVVSALVFTIVAFKASLTFGVATLLFGDPLFILIVLAIYRIILEFFVVAFRISEDMRAARARQHRLNPGLPARLVVRFAIDAAGVMHVAGMRADGTELTMPPGLPLGAMRSDFAMLATAVAVDV